MSKILILDGNTQIPQQLENKFHEVIVIPNTEDLLKITNVDAGNQETIENFNSEISKYIRKNLVLVFGSSNIKKFKFNRETLLTLLQTNVYREYFCNKFNLTLDQLNTKLELLDSFKSVKAKYEREFKSNEELVEIRTELENIVKLSNNFRKASPDEYRAYSDEFIGYFGCLDNRSGSLFTEIYDTIQTVKGLIKACEFVDVLKERYWDISSPNITRKQIYSDIKDVKLAEKLSKYVSLYHTLSIVPKLSNLKPNDYLVVGEGCAKVINKFNNLGLRRTTLWFQLLNLKVCKTGTGANIVFIRTLSGAQTNINKMAYFFSQEFAAPLIPEMPKSKRVITTSDDAISTLDKLINMPVGSQFGFDYETNGEEINTSRFETVGFSIANTICAVYFELRYIKLLEGDVKRQLVMNKLKEFLDKHATAKSKSKTWVFNYSFELTVSYKEFGVYYEFWDLVVYRNISGNHMEWWSLKYTSQYYLRVRSWDDTYDGIMDVIFQWLYKWNPSLGKKGDWEPRNDRDYFINCLNECNDQRIVPYRESFIWLYDNGYNTKFTCIPAELIGGYGALDSYYTVWGAKINQGKYDDRCELTFMDNLRLGARLTGVYRNDKIYDDYLMISKKLFCYSVFHLARFANFNYIWYRIKESTSFNKLNEIQDYLRKISENDFTYWVLTHYIDYKNKDKLGRSIINYFKDDNYEGHINTNLLNHELGAELAERISNVVLSVNDWYTDVKEVNQDNVEHSDDDEDVDIVPTVEVIDGDVIKELSRKLGELLFPLLKYHKEATYRYSTEEIKRRFYQSGSDSENKKRELDHMNKLFDEAIGIARLYNNYLDFQNSPIMKLDYYEFMKQDRFVVKMKSYNIDKFFTLLFDYYRITSPGVFKDTYTKCGILYEKEYKVMSCFDKFDPCGNYRPDLVEKYLPFESWDDMVAKVDEIWKTDDSVHNASIAESLQPKKDNDFTQAKRYYYINDSDFNGEFNQVCINDLFNKLVNINKQPMTADGNSILMVCLGAIGKRHTKMISNYFYGTYCGSSKMQCEADKNLASTTEGNVFRMYPKFYVNSVTTKRWSSPYHTIYGKSTSKRVITAPPGYGVSYFDISSAEVRSAAYMSGDPTLISEFEAGLDPYIELAKLKFGQDAPKSVLKANRKIFKTCLLAQLYGQSVAGMGARLKITEAESQDVVDQLRSHLPVLFKWIERKQNYCVANRKIETFLGDDLEIFEFQAGRLRRVGINYCVQGNTAAILAHGFYNLIRKSDEYGLGITPFITVHDSSINYVPWKQLPYLNEFYRENFTEFIRKETGIVYTFDTMIGADYTVPCVLVNDNQGEVELTGNDYALNDIVNSIGRDHIITDEDWNFDTKLTDPMYDMMYNFEAASFGSNKTESTIKFKLTGL